MEEGDGIGGKEGTEPDRTAQTGDSLSVVQTEDEVFSKKPLLKRSPVHTTPVDTPSVGQYFTPISEYRPKKRKLKLSPGVDDGVMKNFIGVALKMCIRVDKLGSLIKDNKNTKKEIKDVTHSLTSLAKDLQEMKGNICDDWENDELIIESEEEFDEDLMTEGLKVTMVNESHEVVYCGKCKAEIVDEEKKIKEIKKVIKKYGDSKEEEVLKEFKNTIELKWPDEAFKKVAMCKTHVKDVPKNNTKVILVQKEEFEENVRWMEEITGQTGISNQPADKLVLYEKQSRYRIIGDEDEGGSTETSIVIKRNISESLVDIESLYNNMRKIAECKEVEDIVLIVVGKNDNLVRKIAEAAFFDSAKGVRLLQTPETSGIQKTKTEAILVRKGEGSYADMARKLKEEVVPESMGVKIRAFKETKEGDILIVTDQGKAETLKREISSKLAGAEVETRYGRETIIIMDLDPSTSKEEVSKAVGLITNKPPDAIFVKSIKKNNRGSAVAALSIPADDAHKLVATGSVRIGWVTCKVKIDMKIDRCFNCLEMGHLNIDCRKPRVNELRCFSCTQGGHLAKACPNQRYCLECKTSGHRSDSFTCPRYREIANRRV